MFHLSARSQNIASEMLIEYGQGPIIAPSLIKAKAGAGKTNSPSPESCYTFHSSDESGLAYGIPYLQGGRMRV